MHNPVVLGGKYTPRLQKHSCCVHCMCVEDPVSQIQSHIYHTSEWQIGQEYIIKERVSNSSMGHQKWQPQVFLDITVNSCLWYKCWVSESTLSRWWLWVVLWNLTYGSQNVCQHSCKPGSQRSCGCHFWWTHTRIRHSLFYYALLVCMHLNV